MVAPLVAAAGIEAGAQLAGGLLNMNALNSQAQATDDANKWFLAQRQAEFNKNVEMEYDFAKNGLSWKIADAAKNGISPLAALGAPGVSFSPVSVGGGPIPSDGAAGMQALTAGLTGAGQSVSRALLATKSKEEKASEALALARQSKENDLLDLQIANARMKLAGMDSPGMNLGYQSVLNLDGTTSIIPSEAAARSAHAEAFGPLLWSIHNGMIPSVQGVAANVLPPPDQSGWRTLDVRDARDADRLGRLK